MLTSSIKQRFKEWLNDVTSSPIFEIQNIIFKEMKMLPGKMIPHYHSHELPDYFINNRLELLRHRLGACLLIKRDKINYSLFPELPEPVQINIKKITSRIQNSLLFRTENLNEDNYFFLSQRIGVLKMYLENELNIDLSKELELCGRFQGIIDNRIILGDVETQISQANFEIDHILENDDIIVIIELKKKFYKTQSIHQLIFPYLKVRDDPRTKIMIYFETEHKKSMKFRIYKLNIHEKNNMIVLDKSFFSNGIEYHVENWQESINPSSRRS